MATHQDALDILFNARRQLGERLADAVVGSKEVLLREAAAGKDPLACDRDLDHTAAGLVRLAAAIATLRRSDGDDERVPPGNAPARDRPHEPDPTFDRFIDLVAAERLEQASRQLARILHMPLDRMVTATRFFHRAVRSDPTLARRLTELRPHLKGSSSAQCMDLLVKTFGFQAVESRMAVGALQDRPQEPCRA